MTLGQAVDRTVNAGIVAAGHIAQWLIDRLSPFNAQEARAYLAMSGAEALAEREAQTEVFEPGEIAEPVGEYPEVPAQPQTAGQTCVMKVAALLAEWVMTAFAYDKQLGDKAIDMATEILRAVPIEPAVSKTAPADAPAEAIHPQQGVGNCESRNHRTTPLSVVFTPADSEAIRAELAQHEAVMVVKRLEAVYGPRAFYGPIEPAPTGNVIDIFTGKAIQ